MGICVSRINAEAAKCHDGPVLNIQYKFVPLDQLMNHNSGDMIGMSQFRQLVFYSQLFVKMSSVS